MIWHPPSPYNRHHRSLTRLALVVLLLILGIFWTSFGMPSGFQIGSSAPEVRRHSTVVEIVPNKGKLISQLPLPASQSIHTTPDSRTPHKGHNHPPATVAIKTLEPPQAASNYQFPSWSECEDVKEKADALPDMLVVPIEESVQDVVLEGWEDTWVAKARYQGPHLAEPKIDFVYNCKSIL